MSAADRKGLARGAGNRAGLGRGLASLLGDEPDREMPTERIHELPLGALRPSAYNPRKAFDEEGLQELAASLLKRGLVQPIVVRAIENELYEIVAGERRYRAARLAGLDPVPVLVVEADDGAALEIAIVENVQRADLSSIEEARGYAELIARFGYTQTDLAQTLAKSRSHVANTLRLLKLPLRVQDHIDSGRLTAGQARPLIGHEEAEALAERIISQGLSAREVERLVAEPVTPVRPVQRPVTDDARFAQLTERFTRRLGSGIRIAPKPRGGITITLPDDAALERLLGLLDD